MDMGGVFLAGYFTTRPASKAYIRGATSYLQVARQVEVLARQRLGWSRGVSTEILEEAVALTQHHDAITGTEKQHVANDYHKRLARGSIPSQRYFLISAFFYKLCYFCHPTNRSMRGKGATIISACRVHFCYVPEDGRRLMLLS